MKYPNIANEMLRHNQSIGELAKILDLSENNLAFKLNGQREFTLMEIEKIAEVFNCSLEYLIRE